MNNELEKSTVIKVYIRLHYITFDYQMLHLFTHSVNISNVIISNYGKKNYPHISDENVVTNTLHSYLWKVLYKYSLRNVII